MVHLILQWFSREDFAAGRVLLRNGYAEASLSRFPEMSSPESLSLGAGLGVIVGKGMDEEKVFLLDNLALTSQGDALLFTFSVGEQWDVTTKNVKKVLRARILAPEGVQPWFPPNCCVVDEALFASLRDLPFKEELRSLQGRNDWNGMIATAEKRLGPIGDFETRFPHAWEDPDLLSTLGFAMGKLAETSTLPLDKAEMKSFLATQKRHRKLCLKWRTRHTELQPGSPSPWSNLAYFHYQNITELTASKGRTDGNVWDELTAFFRAVNEALRLDPTRLKDRYRKGRVLGEVLPDLAAFGDSRQALTLARSLGLVSPTEPVAEGSSTKLAERFRLQALAELRELDRGYTELPQEHTEKSRCRCEYLKGLFTRGKVLVDLADPFSHFNEFDEYWNEAWGEIEELDPGKKALAYVDEALDCFVRVWKEERTTKGADSTTPVDGIIAGVHRIYQIGKTRFLKYQILRRSGGRNGVELLARAEEALNRALALPWPMELQHQSKDYIAERLARVMIEQGRAPEAVEILLQHGAKRRLPSKGSIADRVRNANMSEYVVRTLVLAMTRAEYPWDQIYAVIQNATTRKGWKDRWKTLVLSALTHLRAENFAEANRSIQEALQEAERIGKKNTASLLALAGDIEERQGHHDAAVDLYRMASDLEPWHPRWSRRHSLLLSAMKDDTQSAIPNDEDDFPI